MGFLSKVQGSLSGNAANGPSFMLSRDPVMDDNAIQSEISKDVHEAWLEKQTAFEKVWSEMSAEEKSAYAKANKDYLESAGRFSDEFSGDAVATVSLNPDRGSCRSFSEWFDSLPRTEQLDYMMKNADVPLSAKEDVPKATIAEIGYVSTGRIAGVYVDLGLPDEDKASVDSQFGE